MFLCWHESTVECVWAFIHPALYPYSVFLASPSISENLSLFFGDGGFDEEGCREAVEWGRGGVHMVWSERENREGGRVRGRE